MQHNNPGRDNSSLEEQDNLSNMARLFGDIGWEKRLCDLTKEEVLGVVAYVQKMKDIRDEFTEQGLLEFEQSVTSSNAQDDFNDPIPF
jgi:hypothetical protein